jgi:multicomponent Na+:H+ antiporter subunit E
MIGRPVQSPQDSERPEVLPSSRVRWRFLQQLPLLVGLIVLWMVLWGELSLRSLLSGIVVALVVSLVFYLPPVELGGRLNPFWGAVFLVRFLGDVVVASAQVAWLVLRPSGVRENSVIAAPLATRSDFIMTLTATALSLVPGSIVLEVDRNESILYLHVINSGTLEAADRFRAKVRRVERGIVRAVGSKQDLEALR